MSKRTNRQYLGVIAFAIFLSVAAVGIAANGFISAGPTDEPINVEDWNDLVLNLSPENDGKVVKINSDSLDFYGLKDTIVLKSEPGTTWSITLDLNGHSINRTCEYESFTSEYARVFYVGKGVTLTIRDSNADNLGSIKLSSTPDAMDSNAFGGAIYNEGNLIIEGGTFRSNQANASGGAVYNAEGAEMTVTGGAFALNYAKAYGGAIYNAGTLNISDAAFSGNIAGEEGGAIYNVGLLKVSNTFMFKNESNKEGGAIYNSDNGRMILIGGEISNNTSAVGGAIGNISDVAWTDDEGVGHFAADITGTTFRSNRACEIEEAYSYYGCGGAIVNRGNMSMANVTLDSNVADVDGGGIFNFGDVVISDSTLKDNVTVRGSGGAVCNYNDYATLSVRDTVMSDNHAQKSGGAVYNYLDHERFAPGDTDNSVALVGCIIMDNNAADSCGGAIYNLGSMKISLGIISGNSTSSTAFGNGGGVANDGELDLLGVEFLSNTSGKDGGALFVNAETTVSALGVAMRDNTTTYGNGGAIAVGYGGTLELSTTKIEGNSALLRAGAIMMNRGSVLNISGIVKIIDNDAVIGKNIYLDDGEESGDGAVIGFSGMVTEDSKIDFAMKNPYDPFTFEYDMELCSQKVFTYNEVTGFPIKMDKYSERSELFCDYELWNEYKIGMVLITTWEQFMDVAESAPDRTEVALANNIYAGDNDRIEVKKDLIIDLNGFTIDRQRTKSDEDGHVFEIESDSTVTIKDGIGTGIITGGYAEHGGAINIHEGSKLLFESGTIMDNMSSNDGGAILNRGELEMTGGAIIDNYADDNGGAIFTTDESSMNLYNVLIACNSSRNNGGAIYVQYEKEGTIQNCRIIYNRCLDESGGAIYMNAEDVMLYLIDDIICYNSCDDDGGAFKIVEGGIAISGDKTEISHNSAEYGGAFYTDERKVTINGNIKIQYNTASKDGGAIYTEGIVDVGSGVEISHNEAGVDGGAIFINDGSTVNIGSGSVLTYNTSGASGGAIFIGNNGNLNIHGGQIMYNTAGGDGGGIFLGEEGDDLDIEGDPEIRSNEAVSGNGIFLHKGDKINVVGVLKDSAYILVSLSNDTGRFTRGYSDYNYDVDPSVFFDSPDGYLVVLDDEEASLSASVSGKYGNDSDFIPWTSQITDYYSLNDKNWMSGISGDRRISEINIPGTHDSGMKKTESRFIASLGDFMHMHYMAKTQNLYINEQLDAGVRLFDIRVNNQHLVPVDNPDVWLEMMSLAWGLLTWSTPTVYDLEDDGENLWICHGKDSIGGTFYAEKSNGDDLSVDDVLNWMKNFLILHPTETLIVGFDPECQDDDEKAREITMERLYGKLLPLTEEINPSTGKPFIYLQPGNKLGDKFTEYPYLKDCRGQMIVYGDKIGKLPGIMYPVKEQYSQDVGFNCSIEEKIESLDRFLDEHVSQVTLTSDVTEHLTVKHNIGFNVGPTDTLYYVGKYFQSFVDKDIGPLYNASKINPLYLAEGKPFDQRGQYVGWVKTDGADAKNNGYIWRSNFPDPNAGEGEFQLNYATVKVESELGAYPIQSYDLLLGTEIAIPGCIYEDHGDLEFVGWKVDDKTYIEGDKYTLTGDTTFTAVWKDTKIVTIWFVNDDDSLLDEFHYVVGTLAKDIAAQAPVATKEATAQYTYYFSGWEPQIEDATIDTSYRAKYDAVLNKYDVTWMTWDGLTVLEIDAGVDYGTAPQYDGLPQYREETQQHTYEFIGWSLDIDSEDGKPVEELPTVSSDVTYYASFKKVIKQFKITILNWDGTVLSEGMYNCETQPDVYLPVDDPTREPSEGKYYEFAGWSPEPAAVTEDATYTATYNESLEQRYCITFKDWNATVLSKTWYSAGTSYSEVVIPDDPVRESTDEFSYNFIGWSPSVPTSGEVTESATYAALYDAILNKYTVKFVDWDGTVLSAKDYDFGTKAEDIVVPADPQRPMDDEYAYAFAGWVPKIVDVTTDETYIATYTVSIRTYTVTWENYDGTVLEIDEDVAYGSIPAYNGATPEKPETETVRYIFSSWDPSVKFVTGDVTYHAVFSEEGQPFNVTYEINGGVFKNDLPDHAKYIYNVEFSLYDSDDVEKEYYDFGGWHDNPELTGDSISVIAAGEYGDKTYYAKWIPVEFKIAYDDVQEGYSGVTSFTVETPTFTLVDPAKEAYEFLGWALDDPGAEIIKEVTIEQGSFGSRTYYAKWDARSYDIEYYDGEIKLEGIEPAQYKYGEKTALGMLPAKSGCTRVGWYTTIDLEEGTEIDSIPDDAIGTQKVYAKYIAAGPAYWVTLPAAIEGLVFIFDPEEWEIEQELVTAGEVSAGTAYYSIDGGKTFSKDIPKGKYAGEYRVDYKIVHDDQDYDFGWTFVNIDKATAHVKTHPTPAEGLIYDQTEHGLFSDDGDVVEYGCQNWYYNSNGDYWQAWTPSTTEAGTYTIKYRAQPVTTWAVDNLLPSEEYTVTVTVEKGEVDWDIFEKLTPKEGLVYNGKPMNIANPYPVADRYNIQYSLDGVNYSWEMPVATDAGDYTVYYMFKDDSNYKDSTVQTITATIGKADAKWLMTPIALDMPYTGNPMVLLFPGFTTAGTAVYRIGEEGEYSSKLPTATECGDYTIWYAIDGGKNYNGPEAKSVTAAIKKAITPTVSIEGWAYGENPSKPVVTGNEGGADVIFSYKERSAGEDKYIGIPPTEAGEYTIKATIQSTNEYFGATAYADFTVTKAKIYPTVTIEGWTYGNEANKPVVTGAPGEATLTYRYKAAGASDSTYTKVVPSDAGNYVLEATVSETEGALGATITTKFTIQKADIEPIVIIVGWKYGYYLLPPIVVNNPGMGVVTYMFKAAEAPDEDYSKTLPVDVGNYMVRATVAETSNYTEGTATAEFEITKADLTVKANDISKEYGAKDPELTVTMTGLRNGDAESTIPYTIERVEGEEIGTYDITVTADSTKNYNVIVQGGKFTITPIIVDIPTGLDLIYDGSEQVGVESGEGYTLTGEIKAINAGEYIATATLEKGYQWSDGSSAPVEVKWVIGKKALDNSMVTVSGDFTYDGKEHTVSYTVSDMSGGKEIITADDYSLTSGEKGTDAGQYALILDATETGNYYGQMSAAWSIAQKEATVAAKDSSKAYGEKDPEFTAIVTGTIGEDTVSYTITRDTGESVGTYDIIPSGEVSQGNYSVTYVNGIFTITGTFIEKPTAATGLVYNGTEQTGVPSGEGYTLTGEKKTDAGEYIATASLAEGYLWSDGTTAPAEVKWTIGKKALNNSMVTVSGEYIYDATEQAVSYTVSDKSGGEEIIKSTDYAATSGDKGTNAGKYALILDATETGNYYGQMSAAWSIAQKEATVTANDSSKTYGEADPTLTAKVDGVIDDYAIVYTITRDAGESVGTYDIIPSGEVSQGNYSVKYVNGKFIIKAKMIDVPVGLLGLIYNASEQVGVESGEGYTLADEKAINAGKYTATATLESGYVWSDGSSDPASIPWSIAQKKATVTANDCSKTYGEADPTLTAKVDGVIDNYAIVYTLARDAGEAVGTYDITPSGETSQGNYTVEFFAGTFTIDPITIDVPVGLLGLIYDGSEQVGVKSGEGYALAGEKATNAGNYTATATLEDGYMWSNGSSDPAKVDWSIAQRIATITVDSKEKVYGSADPELTGTVKGLVSESDLGDIVYQRDVGKDVGEYAIHAFYTPNPNYTVTVSDGILTITQKAAIVIADDKVKILDTADPELTATVTGLVGEDELAYAITRAKGETVGTYAITPFGAASQGNYTVTYVNGELSIIYEERTVTDDTGRITVDGEIGMISILIVKDRYEPSDWEGVDLSNQVIHCTYDIGLLNIGQIAYTGDLTITFDVGKGHDGSEVTVYHRGANGIEMFKRTVQDSKVSVTVSDLSPFIVTHDKNVTTNESVVNMAIITVGVLLVIFMVDCALFKRKRP